MPLPRALLVAAFELPLGLASPFTVPFVPSRIHVPSSLKPWVSALEALQRDGAVVLSGLAQEGRSLKAVADELPSLIFGGEAMGAPGLLSPAAPVNGVHDELLEAKRRGLYMPGSGLLPHTDGYVYGDDMPDYVTLLCEQPALRGGGNVLLDGQVLLATLENGTSEERHLAAWLRSADVDLSEPGDAGVISGRPARGPVVQTLVTNSGEPRMKWRRQLDVREAQRTSNWRPLAAFEVNATGGEPAGRYLSLWRPLPEEERPQEVQVRLRELDTLLQVITKDAFADAEFRLASGEALVLDNYRMLHGRAPYLVEEGQEERRIWRVWSWTTDGSGLPPDGARTSNPINDDVFHEAEL